MKEIVPQPETDEQVNVQSYPYGEVIKRHRVELGLTQREVAEQCGITDSALAHFERELRLPSKPVAEGIAKALKLKEEVRAEFYEGLQAARELRARQRVRRNAGFRAAAGVAQQASSEEDIIRRLATDAELRNACLQLQAALRKPGQKEAVLRALEAWAS